MQTFVQACLSSPSSLRQARVLRAIVPHAQLHARLLNSLARLEYVGVRKMLKARRSDDLDLEGLRHMLEEAAHATRLKKAAVALAKHPATVETFRDEHTLAGDAAERYFQAIDHAAAAAAQGAGYDACYWLTSAAIEVRARSFYPTYQRILQETGSPVSVASIITDEQEHLQHMAAELPRHLPEWRDAMQAVMAVEEREFSVYLDEVDRVVAASGL